MHILWRSTLITYEIGNDLARSVLLWIQNEYENIILFKYERVYSMSEKFPN